MGDYALGLTQLLKALEIVETLKIDDALPDVLDGIAGIYYQISDYPEALNYMYKQLEAAERIGDKRRIANAYNNLSVAYSEMGDYTRSAETQHKNLKIAVEIGYRRIECISLLNIAGISIRLATIKRHWNTDCMVCLLARKQVSSFLKYMPMTFLAVLI